MSAAAGNFHRMARPDEGPERTVLTRQGNQNFGTKIGRESKKMFGKMKMALTAPSLIDRSSPHFSGIKRFGIRKVGSFFSDPFHTMLNLPWGRFICLFFVIYVISFLSFAFIYWTQSDSCIEHLDGMFRNALWLSSRTASTLGFDFIRPQPHCTFINLVIMLQVIASNLINSFMLGVVFARFSAPFKRANTIRFSKNAAVHRHPSGYWCLALRVANLRKHQILQPSIRLVVTAVDSITPSNYMFEHLDVEGSTVQQTNLELGFPGNVVHVIRPGSFMYNLSLLEMDTRMMEVLVFVDGIDAMTSKYMSARCAYQTSEIVLNHCFAPLNLEMRGKKLGLDFSDFDKTGPHWPQLEEALESEAKDMRMGSGAWQLRHQTFKRLAERYAHLAPPPPVPGFGAYGGGLQAYAGPMHPNAHHSPRHENGTEDVANGEASLRFPVPGEIAMVGTHAGGPTTSSRSTTSPGDLQTHAAAADTPLLPSQLAPPRANAAQHGSTGGQPVSGPASGGAAAGPGGGATRFVTSLAGPGVAFTQAGQPPAQQGFMAPSTGGNPFVALDFPVHNRHMGDSSVQGVAPYAGPQMPTSTAPQNDQQSPL